MMLPNFNLSAGGYISNSFITEGIKTFHEAIKYIQQLPYSRTSLPFPRNILEEKKGTCSTKHACIKQLSEENGLHSIELNLCIYPMHEGNTPGVGKVLDAYNLPYILEAHTYLSYDQDRFDFTFPDVTYKNWENDILIETSIDVDQITDYKIEYHQSVLKDWIARDHIKYTFEEIWKIREACIKALQS